jgi:hypothetical protein
MRLWSRLAAGLAVALIMLWTGTAAGQSKPACDPQGKVKTPETVGGHVVKVDRAQSKVTLRESDGTVHELQASTETLQDLKVGDRIEAKLREAPKC